MGSISRARSSHERASREPTTHDPVHRQRGDDRAHEVPVTIFQPEGHGAPEVPDLGLERGHVDLLRVARPQPPIPPTPRGPGTRPRAAPGARRALRASARARRRSRGSTRASRSAARRARRVAARAPCRGAPGACRRPVGDRLHGRERRAAREDAEAPEQLLSSSDRRSWLHAMVLRNVRWRGSASRSPEERSSRAESRSRSCSTEKRRSRAAASCSASGSRSRRSMSVGQRRRRLHRRRDRASPAEEERLRVLRRHHRDRRTRRSPASCSRSRLVTRSTRLGAEARSEASGLVISGSRCSALSSTKSARRPCSCRSTDTPRSMPASSLIASASAICVSTVETSRSGARASHRSPPGKDPAHVVRRLDREPRLADPPGPTIVSRRVAGSASTSATIVDFSVTPDERGRRDGQVRRRDGLQRRERAIAELVDPLRYREVLQPMVAEVDAALDRRWPTRSSPRPGPAPRAPPRRSVPPDGRRRRRSPRRSRAASRYGSRSAPGSVRTPAPRARCRPRRPRPLPTGTRRRTRHLAYRPRHPHGGRRPPGAVGGALRGPPRTRRPRVRGGAWSNPRHR